MTFTRFMCNRDMDINEIREVLSLMKNQETSDKYVNTSMIIDGEYAKISVEIDENGNVTLI